MRKPAIGLLVLLCSLLCRGQSRPPDRREAEYYVNVYSRHFGVPIEFVRAIVEQESGWNRCAISSKGAVGYMQLMPETARNLGVRNRYDARENIGGGVLYIALLMKRFGGDLRLVAAAYYAGSVAIATHGLNYRNRDVVNYVASVRARVARQRLRSTTGASGSGRAQ